MKTAERRIEWETTAGNKIVVTVTATAGIERATRSVSSDGWAVDVDKKTVVDTWDVSAMADGKLMPGRMQRIAHPVAYARIGNVGVSKENYDRIWAAIDAAKAEAATDADFAAEKRRQNDCAKIDRQSAELEKNMAFGEL